MTGHCVVQASSVAFGRGGPVTVGLDCSKCDTMTDLVNKHAVPDPTGPHRWIRLRKRSALDRFEDVFLADDHRSVEIGQGFMAPINLKRAGKVAAPAALLIDTAPSSDG